MSNFLSFWCWMDGLFQDITLLAVELLKSTYYRCLYSHTRTQTHTHTRDMVPLLQMQQHKTLTWMARWGGGSRPTTGWRAGGYQMTRGGRRSSLPFNPPFLSKEASLTTQLSLLHTDPTFQAGGSNRGDTLMETPSPKTACSLPAFSSG